MEFKAPTLIPDGVYNAKLLSIEQREPGENGVSQKPYLRWTFKVFTDEDPEGVNQVKNTSLSFGPKSNARKFLQSLLGKPIQPGERIKIMDHLPLDCQVAIEIDHESGYNRITNVMGAKKRQNGKAEEGEVLASATEISLHQHGNTVTISPRR